MKKFRKAMLKKIRHNEEDERKVALGFIWDNHPKLDETADRMIDVLDYLEKRALRKYRINK